VTGGGGGIGGPTCRLLAKEGRGSPCYQRLAHVARQGAIEAWETVLIFGIGGGVSLAALQLAGLTGARTLVTSRDPAKLARAVALGADLTVDGRGDIVKQVMAATGGRGVDVVRRLAASIQSHPEFRADVYARLGAGLPPNARAIVEYAVAEAPDEAGLILLVGSHARDGRSFDGVLGSAIEHLVVEQRPSSDWVGAYEQISTPAPSLRKRLFGMACTSDGHEARLAATCLVADA
jgi:threonine dehydrogenase-like Zn-dependent dehydrogenase